LQGALPASVGCNRLIKADLPAFFNYLTIRCTSLPPPREPMAQMVSPVATECRSVYTWPLTHWTPEMRSRSGLLHLSFRRRR